MARVREKISSFAFGLTVGLLIGCAIFIFKLDDYIRNIQLPGFSKTAVEERTSLAENKEGQTEKAKNSDANNSDNLSVRKKANQLQTEASLNTTSTDTTSQRFVAVPSSDENISVLKEELMGVRNIRVKVEEKVNKADSLAGVIAGVEHFGAGDFMLVEFWKTPLNSKGYKMSRNKVVLYGLPEADVEVRKNQDEYYLVASGQTFKIEYSDEFRRLEKVPDVPPGKSN